MPTKVRRTAARETANRALAKPESVRALDHAIREKAEAERLAKAARGALGQLDAVLRAASRWEGACDRKVAREAKNARARIARMAATGPSLAEARRLVLNAAAIDRGRAPGSRQPPEPPPSTSNAKVE